MAHDVLVHAREVTEELGHELRRERERLRLVERGEVLPAPRQHLVGRRWVLGPGEALLDPDPQQALGVVVHRRGGKVKEAALRRGSQPLHASEVEECDGAVVVEQVVAGVGVGVEHAEAGDAPEEEAVDHLAPPVA